MAYVTAMCKATQIENIKNQLVLEKQHSINVDQGLKQKITMRQRCRHVCINFKRRLKKCFKKCCQFPEHTCIYRTLYNLKQEGTCENFFLKSVVGFVSGFFLTYIFFMFFVFQLNFKLSTATIMCSIVGSILTIGLAFSYKCRCIVLLTLPQFFSKRGRQALLAYAFILAITGPAKNTLHNMSILSESLACGQEQLKAAVRQIIEVIKKPFYAIRDAVKAVVKTIKEIVKKIKEILLGIKRVVMAILKVIKAIFQFLGKILNICNKKLGTPFERCIRVFEDAITDCNAKLGPMFSWLCSITYLVEGVCYIVKIFDFICMVVDFVNDSIIGVVVKKVKTFVRHIRTMFYVRIKFSHSYHFQTNQSKSMNEVAAGIITEIKQRSEGLLVVFDFMSCATSLFFLFIVLRVLQYRYKFLTSEKFDNKFITKDFRRIDMRRAQLEKETVLPLNHRERTMYISVGSLRLVHTEKTKLSRSAVVLGIATLKLCTHMMADYALYWVLTLIRYHARFQSSVQSPNVPTLHIEGHGILADLLKSIVNAFQPLGFHLEIDTVPCLPDPIPPDYDRYVQIGTLLILCWFLTVFEPYGLRLRHSVMCYYHPGRARQRSVWLYNHILRARSSFLKFARRQLKRKMTGNKDITKVTFKEYLRAKIKFKYLYLCLGKDKQDGCLLCGEVFRENDKAKPIRCQTPNCPGMYCEQCFTDLQNLCTICLDPIEYGDLSDISEEKDSSEDERKPQSQKEKKKQKKKRRSVREDENSEDGSSPDSDDDDKPPGTGIQKKTSNTFVESGSETVAEYSDEHTSDYSYSYQEEKGISTLLHAKNIHSSSVDVEKQYLPDYASMEDFVEGDDEDMDDDDKTSELSTSLSKLSRELYDNEITSSSRDFTEELSPEIKTSASNHETGKKSTGIFGYLKAKLSGTPDVNRQEELPLLQTNSESLEHVDDEFNETVFDSTSDAQTISSPTRDNTFSSDTSIHTFFDDSNEGDTSRTNENNPEICLEAAEVRKPVRLDFSSNKDPSRYRKRFKNIKYETVQETPRSSPRLTSPSSSIPTVESNHAITVNDDYELSDFASRRNFCVCRNDLQKTKKKYEKQPVKKERLGVCLKKKKKKVVRFDSKTNYVDLLNASSLALKTRSESASTFDLSDKSSVGIRNALCYVLMGGSAVKFLDEELTTEEEGEAKRNSFKNTDSARKSATAVSEKKVKEVRDSKVSVRERAKSPRLSQQKESSHAIGTTNQSAKGGKPQSTRVGHKKPSSRGLEEQRRYSREAPERDLQSNPVQQNFRHGSQSMSVNSENESTASSNLDEYYCENILGSRMDMKSRKNFSSLPVASRGQGKPFAQENYDLDKSLRRENYERGGKELRSSLSKSAGQEGRGNKSDLRDHSYQENRGNKGDSRGHNYQGNRNNNELRMHGYRENRSSGNNNDLRMRNSLNKSLNQEGYRNKEPRHYNNSDPSGQNSPLAGRYEPNKTQGGYRNNDMQIRQSSSVLKQRRSSPTNSTTYNHPSDTNPQSVSTPEIFHCRPHSCSCTSPQTKIESMKKHACQFREEPAGTHYLEHYRSSHCHRPYSADRHPNCFPENPSEICHHHHQRDCDTCHLEKRHYRQSDDQMSLCSNSSRNTDYMDLAYQNNDEYLDLVQELEDTLSQRNRERVQKTMREFERLSKQNKNLEKPIFDEEDSASQYRNQAVVSREKPKPATPRQSREATYCYGNCNDKQPNSVQVVPCRENTTSYVEKVVNYMEPNGRKCGKRRAKFQGQQQSQVRWEMNPRNGEWYKVYDDGMYNYDEMDYDQPPPPPPPPPRPCTCDCYERCNPRCYNYPRSPPPGPPPRRNYCRCGLAHDERY